LFLDKAPPKLLVAAALLFFTAQRLSDVLSMDWGKVFERDGLVWVKLRQQKTDELIEVPAHRRLVAILRSMEKREGLLVPSPRAGGPWHNRNFSRAWDSAMREAKLDGSGLQRRDLRRTAMVRMAEAGATDAQIAAVSGHTIEQTRQILNTYIPRRGEIAAGAIAAWERMTDAKDRKGAFQVGLAEQRLVALADQEKMLRLARAGVPTQSIANAFDRKVEEVASLLESAKRQTA
jgi:integrase